MRHSLPTPNSDGGTFLKIMVVSDATWHKTGYGIQTKMLCQRLVADGHEVYNFAPGAFVYGKTEADGVTVLSANPGDDRWGNATLQFQLQKYQPDLIITWLDCQGMAAYGLDTTPLYMWAPIDMWPLTQQEANILGRADKVLAASRWGQDVLRAGGIEAEYVPCGFDPEEYYPSGAEGKNWRRNCGVQDDHFLVGMVGINGGMPDRKGYGFAFDAFRRFVDKHDNARMYVHTNPEGYSGAMNLYELRKELDLEGHVFFPPPVGPEGAPVKYMRGAYNAMDVLLHASPTEGFGVPVLEAQKCGTPVVGNAATAVKELLRGSWNYAAEPLTDMLVGTCQRVALPSVDHLYDGLEWVYRERPAVILNIHEYEFDRIYEEKWRPLIAAAPKPIAFDAGPRKLMLGCGRNQREGFVHHDVELFHPHTDVAHDLTQFPYPWEDDSWDYVEMSDVMEHLRGDVTAVLDELWRIIAPGGYLFIHTAEAGSWQLAMDPTHVQGFKLNSFDYYDPETPYGAQYTYSERGWKIAKRTIDSSGGIVVLMTPRKEAPTQEREREMAVTA